jgi:recombination protein RecA
VAQGAAFLRVRNDVRGGRASALHSRQLSKYFHLLRFIFAAYRIGEYKANMAPVAARAALESLLRERRLDTTLTTALPLVALDSERLASTGLDLLDAHLLGGLPRGDISEVTGPRSSGRTSVLLTLMAAATRRGELVALIDTLDRFDPASAVAAGIDLMRLLWIRGHDVPLSQQCLAPDWEPSRARPGRTRASLVSRAVDRAIKAINLVVQAGGFGLVALDVADVPADVVRALPFTTWMRLQRAVDGRDTAVVIVGGEPTARSAGGVSIRLDQRRTPAADGLADTTHAACAPLPVRRRPADTRANAFHQGVLASRRPFLASAADHRPAGRWTGPLPHARRFRGLSSDASVVRAHHCAQSTSRVALDFGK